MSITANDYALLSKLLDQGLDLPLVERGAWVDALDASLNAYKPRLKQLLAETVGFEATDMLARFATQHAAAARPEFNAGALIGPYTLVRELGTGGMGTVWLGERNDGLIKHTAALKLPMFPAHNRALAERFAREAEILFALTHRHIARLYLSGTTAHGQPYLAMEYVEGAPINTYCDTRRLDVRARVTLFQQVLSAVQYAHAHMVIHRDLKPSNILVGTDGEVKLLDFGIAKLLSLEGKAQETELTHFGGRALTPSYASPEQLTGAPLTTASDVYSLGVVLYELLAGTRPYKPKGESRGALEDAVLKDDPPPPSDALKRLVASHAQRTDTMGAGIKQVRALKGDLDTIVLKALKKKPEERYATVNAMALDIERTLAGEPIEARADSGWYRLSKLAHRHRRPLAVAGALVATVTIAGGYALRQTQSAELSAARAQSVETFMQGLFDSMGPDITANRTFTAKELLDRSRELLQKQISDTPQTKQTLSLKVADLYRLIGEHDAAISQLREQAAIARQAQDGAHLAKSQAWLGYNLLVVYRDTEAQDALKEAEALTRAHLPSPSETLAMILFSQGVLSVRQAKFDQAAQQYAQALRQFEQLHGPQSAGKAMVLHGQGRLALQKGDVRRAEALYLQARALDTQPDGRGASDHLELERDLANVEATEGDLAAALARLQAALPEMYTRLGGRHSVTRTSEYARALALAKLGRLDEADRAVDRYAESAGRGESAIAYTAYLRGYIKMLRGNFDEAHAQMKQIVDWLDLKKPGGSPDSDRFRRVLGENELRRGKTREAMEILRTIEVNQLGLLGEDHVDVALTRVLLGIAQLREGSPQAALARLAAAERVFMANGYERRRERIAASAYRAIAERALADRPLRAANAAGSDPALRESVRAAFGWQVGADRILSMLETNAPTQSFGDLPIVY